MSYDDEFEGCYDDCDCDECLDKRNSEMTEQQTNVEITEQQKAIESLCSKLAIEPELLKTGIERLVTGLVTSLDNSVRTEIRQMVINEVRERIKASITQSFDSLVQEGLNMATFKIEQNWSTREVTIKDLIREELTAYTTRNLGNAKVQEVVKGIVTELLGKDLAERVKQCVEEIKAETINQIGNEAMKTIVQNTAHAIKKDSRLAVILGISN